MGPGKAGESCQEEGAEDSRQSIGRHEFKKTERTGLEHEGQFRGAQNRQERACLSFLFKLFEDKGCLKDHFALLIWDL